MPESAEKSATAPLITAAQPDRTLQRRLRFGYFTLQGLNSLAASYYFNYVFFYMKEHFGFGNRGNLLLSALYGIIYMFMAWYAGLFGPRHGYFFALRVGFYGMALYMVLGGIAPLMFGYSHTTMLLEWVILTGWTVTMCFTWPTLQALLSHHQSPGESARTAGIYNITWAGTAAAAYLTSGPLLDYFSKKAVGGEILFWVSAGLSVIQILMLPRLQKLDATVSASEPAANAAAENSSTPHTQPTSKAKSFVWLARIANPFAYVAIYGLLPVFPKLSDKLGLTPTYASLVFSVWFWARLGAFAWFWRWTQWHYRFRWLLGSFLAMIASFISILLSSNIWMLIAAQAVFGLTIGLIYYSSLFYSMDLGESKGKGGGLHEAAIGLGIFIGPTAGVAALQLFPQYPNAGTWGISALLAVGLLLFLLVRYRSRSQPGNSTSEPI
jgi:MFS family permease